MAIHSRTGFTLIEAFFVMLLITLFTSFSLGYLQKVRSEARDVRRLADINQLTSALELYQHSHNQYPPGKNVPVGTPEIAGLDRRGWVRETVLPVYLYPAPSDPLPTAASICVKNVSRPCIYNYTRTTHDNYSIRFYLEHGVPPLSAPGLYQATPRGYRP